MNKPDKWSEEAVVKELAKFVGMNLSKVGKSKLYEAL